VAILFNDIVLLLNKNKEIKLVLPFAENCTLDRMICPSVMSPSIYPVNSRVSSKVCRQI
jgi:hypothetical protein